MLAIMPKTRKNNNTADPKDKTEEKLRAEIDQLKTEKVQLMDENSQLKKEKEDITKQRSELNRRQQVLEIDRKTMNDAVDLKAKEVNQKDRQLSRMLQDARLEKEENETRKVYTAGLENTVKEKNQALEIAKQSLETMKMDRDRLANENEWLKNTNHDQQLADLERKTPN